MTQVTVVADVLYVLGGAGSQTGRKIGFVKAGAKASQNDTWLVSNAGTIDAVYANVDASGANEACTWATNVVTLTSATATACSALIVFR